MKKILTALLLISTVLAVPIAHADQNDPRLETLFVKLKEISNLRQAQFLSAAIWEIWAVHDDDQINDLYIKGDMAMRNQNPQAALEYYSQVTELAPDFAEGWNKRATIYYLMGDYHASLADIVKVLELEPRHFGALSGRGLCFLELQKFQPALNAFKKALEVNPWLPDAQKNIEMLKRLIKQQA